MTLLPALVRLAQLQHEAVDRLAVQEAAQAAVAEAANDPKVQLGVVTRRLQLRSPKWLPEPDAAVMPALVFEPAGDGGEGRWGILRGRNAQGRWISEWWDTAATRWSEQAHDALTGHAIAALRLAQPWQAASSPLYRLVRNEVFAQPRLLGETLLGGLLINAVALAASFYSMQVYDRVVPTGAAQTLLVLTLGVLVAIVFEWVARRVRSDLHERLIDQVDQRLARTVYLRFLNVRLDQMPHSVGELAARMRGYEAVRSFFTAVTANLLVDAPFALLFLLVIALVGGQLVLVPVVFFVVSLLLGVFYSGRVDVLARHAASAANHKSGLLVESIEGAETIKSGQGGWRMLSRWMLLTDQARDAELAMRRISERSQQLTATFQQAAYVLLVAFGALQVSRGEMTIGALIACSILAGRALAPVSLLPVQLVQWAHTRAALRGLDQLWSLQDDHHGQESPVLLEKLRGAYRLEDVAAGYGGSPALGVPALAIAAGEKVGVLGPVGAGKTTLLRLLSGMYKPQEGRVLLDDVDIAHVAKPSLAEQVGYLQQEGRLFAGTLRDNLLLGLVDPGAEAVLAAARATGLHQAVILPHAKGLQREIFEGGTGLSAGQRQLVNLTRVLLRKPRVWLLDEPTASMDRSLEMQVTQALAEAIGPQDTLVLVTHKLEMLELVDRLVVVASHRIVLDGPKAQVLQQLQGAPARPRRAEAVQEVAP